MKKVSVYLFYLIAFVGVAANALNILSPVSPLVYEIKSDASYTREIDYWKGVILKYPTYKDGYMELARLSILDHDNTMAAYYMDKWERL